jgi:hypothetical protein
MNGSSPWEALATTVRIVAMLSTSASSRDASRTSTPDSWAGGTRLISILWVSLLVTLVPNLTGMPMNGTVKLNWPPTARAARAWRTILTELTRRSRPSSVVETFASLMASLIAAITSVTGTPSSVTLNRSS